MVEQESVKAPDPYPVKVELRDFEGKVVRTLQSSTPLAFPYLLWKNQLFVTSKDNVNIYLQRSFYLLMDHKDEVPASDKH
jgi:hypothetical protein